MQRVSTLVTAKFGLKRVCQARGYFMQVRNVMPTSPLVRGRAEKNNSRADDTDSRTVINNNPLPDITHDEFISLTGPLFVPENYAFLNMPPNSASPEASQQPQAGTALGTSTSRPSTSAVPPTAPNARPIPNSPAPIDWIHFEGRSVKTTLSNIMGLDGLARERKWRSHCVFSVDVGRRARQGVEAVRPPPSLLVPSTT